MKTIQAAALLSLSVGSVAFSQQAFQWKVSDGGNGHWYSVVPEERSWSSARTTAIAMGGHLVSITSQQENAFVGSLAPYVGSNVFGAWAGGYQTDTTCGSGCAWAWVTGEPWSYSNWWGGTGEPNDASGNESLLEIFVYQESNYWNDAPDSDAYQRRFVVEWSADCNNDGIVDYGQCRDGSLPDYNGNNIPDCCEQGTPCVVDSYPVQWRVSEGGNGHWYQVVGCAGCCFSQSTAVAVGLGAQLASLDLAGEQARLLELIPSTQAAKLGGFRTPNSDLFSGWQWLSGEPFNPSLVSWAQGNPGCCGPDQYWLYLQATPGGGYGLHDGFNCSPQGADFVVMEWSADCNNDGIVDKGQILRGQLADSDNDGIPNVCECVCDVFRDFNVNGIDLGILLGQWGPANQFTVTDFNGDGVVDGADLGQLLAAWGPCPN